MDITSLISLINSISSGNANAQSNEVMNFFAQNQNNITKQTNSENDITSQNQGLNLNQILPLISMLGGKNAPNIASLFPLFNMMNLPNGMPSISNIPGMQNFAPFMQNIAKNQEKNQDDKIIHLKSNNTKISDYKKI